MREIARMRLNRLTGVLLFGLATAWMAAGADSRPNYSGEWKLNLEKSDFGPLRPPTSRTDRIDHKDSNLNVTTIVVNPQGENTRRWSCTTDGKECTNTIGPASLKTTVKWEGDALMVDSKGTFNDNEVQFKDKWTLSEDGKMLTINRHLASQMGEADQRIVMEKQ